MAKEIERKFLVTDLTCIQGLIGTPITQAYVAEGNLLVRVRRAGNQAFLTLKGPKTGFACEEFEYSIPLSDAMTMLEQYGKGGGHISKTRYLVPVGAHTFEVDVFEGVLVGLVVAEVEMADENATVELPAWLGPEVSADHFFANSALARLTDDDSLLWVERACGHFRTFHELKHTQELTLALSRFPGSPC